MRQSSSWVELTKIRIASIDPIEKVVSQNSRSLLKENAVKRQRGEDLPPYEIGLTRKDGSEIPVLTRATKITYEEKPAIQFSFVDITERKGNEERLRQSEERYRSLFDRCWMEYTLAHTRGALSTSTLLL